MEQAYGVSFGAVLEPAREVGGDLYGVCAAGPERLVIFLGDVSGKGIPASMFMVRAISLARLLAREIAEPERILARLNDELAADNPSGMFVTFLCAVFEPESGRLTLANAGHCRPVLLPAGEPPRWAVKNLGTALGFEPGLEFERTELTLHDGDALILYSDGVSEAFNPQEECYGNDRLLADASGFAGQSAPAITAGLLRKVRAFAGSAPQSDDIAILTLKVERRDTAGEHGASHDAGTARHARGSHARRGSVAGVCAGAAACRRKPSSVWRWRWKSAAATSSTTRCKRDAQQTFQVAIERSGDRLSSNCATAARSSIRPLRRTANRRPTTMICPAAGAFNSSAVTRMKSATARSGRKRPAPDKRLDTAAGAK